jgi:hypothetical protein
MHQSISIKIKSLAKLKLRTRNIHILRDIVRFPHIQDNLPSKPKLARNLDLFLVNYAYTHTYIHMWSTTIYGRDG